MHACWTCGNCCSGDRCLDGLGNPAAVSLSAFEHQKHTHMGLQPNAILRDGPYVWTVVKDSIITQRPKSPTEMRPVRLPLFVTVPMASTTSSTVPPGPFPVCVLLNGFQARAGYYAPLARRLASWGVLVLQYNAPALTIIPDSAELPFLGPVVEWLKDALVQGTQPALQGRADLDRLVIAGHSRGGKLAALHYCAGKVAGVDIRTAFLIDPVDNTAQTPESPAYPSATKALRACRKPFGMAAAGLIGASNPEGSNWKLFQAAAAAGSWTMEIKRAGHTTFIKAPTLAETWLLDRVFGGGKLDRDTAVSQTAAAMIAWFQQQLQPQSAGLQPVLAAAPLASTALHAAAAAAVGPHYGLNPAAVDETVGSATASAAASAATSSSSSSLLGGGFPDAFLCWVKSPMVLGEVDFTVKQA